MDVKAVKQSPPVQEAKPQKQVERSLHQEMMEQVNKNAQKIKSEPVINTQGQTTGRMLNVTA